jgi:hypothetical protein
MLIGLIASAVAQITHNIKHFSKEAIFHEKEEV